MPKFKLLKHVVHITLNLERHRAETILKATKEQERLALLEHSNNFDDFNQLFSYYISETRAILEAWHIFAILSDP